MAQKGTARKTGQPRQQQPRPGKENKMNPQPVFDNGLPGSGRLLDRVAIITGGDSGIGRAVAILFAKEGADIAIVYLNEHDDANLTKELAEAYGRKCILISGDVSKESFCKTAVAKTVKQYGRIDILVNNAGIHYENKNFGDITSKALLKTFYTDFFAYFWMAQAALPHMRAGSSIINTTSVTAYRGSAHLVDYSAAKGAIVSFTRSLSGQLAEKDIRVNGVAPGPIWTPLIPSSFEPEEVASHGTDVPLKRAGQPAEVAPAFLFLACSNESSYVTGQVIHPNGGEIING